MLSQSATRVVAVLVAENQVREPSLRGRASWIQTCVPALMSQLVIQSTDTRLRLNINQRPVLLEDSASDDRSTDRNEVYGCPLYAVWQMVQQRQDRMSGLVAEHTYPGCAL